MSKPSFLAELQRRHVYKVGAAYAVAAWLAAQVVTQVLPVFNVSLLAQRVLVIILMAGFPVAVVMSWVFDITSSGIVRTDSAPRSDEPPSASHDRRSMDRKLNYVLASLVILAICFFIAERLQWLRFDPMPASDSKSIAILPFENLSEDKSNAYFAQGIEDEILTQLAKLGDLRVISRASTQRYASNPSDLREVARQLGVDNVLEGSVQKSGNAVHVNVQLVRAATDDPLWAESYDRELNEIFRVEGEVAGDIAGHLHARLTGAEQQALGKAGTDNPRAYNAHLQGLALSTTAASRKDWQTVIDLFQKAVAEDPAFAEAWTDLAAAQLEPFLFLGEASALASAKDAIDVALRLQPESANAWRLLGEYRMYGVKDYATAGEAFGHALRIAPNDPRTLSQLGSLKQSQGKFDDAFDLMQKATATNPRDAQLFENMAEVRYAQRRFADARTLLQRAHDIEPEAPKFVANIALTYLSEGDVGRASRELSTIHLDTYNYFVIVALSQLARQKPDATDATIADFERLLSRHADLDVIEIAMLQTELGNLNTCAGKPDHAAAAFQAVATALESARKSNHVDPFLPMYLSTAYASLGKKDAAIESAQEGLSLAANDFERRPTALTFLAQAQMLGGDSSGAAATLGDLLSAPGSFIVPATPSMQQLQQDCVWAQLRETGGLKGLSERAPSDASRPF